jgi:hypothetical protein
MTALIVAKILYRQTLIMYFRWMISFAVFVDIDKEKIILNHALFFWKKKIALKDIKEVDVLNGNIILFGSIPFSKWQKWVMSYFRLHEPNS